MTGTNAPVADWVTIPELYRDPFPIYERLRAEGGVHWVPAVGRYLVTSYDAVHATELDQEIFSANEEGSLQIRAMGHSMLRRDDPEHYIERKAWQPALRPGVVKRVWTDVFRANANRYLDAFIAQGPGADLVWDFAAPYAAENLRQIVGLYNSSQEDLQRWSQTMIDATGNYADDPEVWRRGEQSYTEVDEALDDMLRWHTANPDHSLISQLLRIPDYEMPLERIRANLKMTIGGGLNEPRDALGVTAWALLRDPEQLAAVRADPALWHAAFDESIRWIAPIGMYSRQTTREVELARVTLPAGARLGICILSANRDTAVWDAPERFDLRREVKPHLAFGKGVHVCLGAWVARAEVADVALPALFERLDGLRLSASRPAEVGGWVFRGMTQLPVEWDHVAAPNAGDPGEHAPTQAAAHPADPAPQPRIAIVGSGPAGCFTAQAARRVFPGSPIDVFDDLPTPYGLVRYGVAADHPGTKAVARQFDRLFADPGVAFRGNVRLGRDVTLAQLRTHYDAVVLATGLREDARLAVPGAERVRGAGSLTRHLNAHPDEAVPRPLGATVAVIGHGNVALDIARLLTRDAAGLDGSDIDDAAHRRLAGQVTTVHLIGRSEPSAAKFDPVMVRELATLPGVSHVVHGAGPLPDDGRDARIDAVRALTGAEPSGTPRVRIEWWFGAVPERILGASDIGASDIGASDISAAADDPGAVVALDIAHEGETVRLAVDDVISAIGFAPNADTPLPSGLYSDGRVEAGLYAAGWLRRGPRGTIPDQRADARGLAQQLAEDLRSGTITARGAGLPPVPGEVNFSHWRRIDQRERLDAAPGRTRAKLATRAAMLDTAADPGFDPLLDPASGRSGAGGDPGAGAPELPVTILFATESGGAELVAEELARLIPNAEVRDLADTHPEQLDPDRLALLICATYGDGEVPTSARPFHAALAAGQTRLDGLRYAVFGMGDRSYDRTYSRGSELVDEALAGCGAVRVGEYGRHDAAGPIPASEVAEAWAQGVLAELAEAAGAVAGHRG